MENQTDREQPGLLTGAIVGFVLLAPVIVIYYIGNVLFSLPFVPFDLFDVMARVLPGDIIRFGISVILGLIETFNLTDLGETSDISKTLEHIQGIMMVMGMGAGIGAGVYYLLQKRRFQSVYAVGTIAGLLTGVVFALMNLWVRTEFTAEQSALVRVLWITVPFLVWGGALAWIYDDLTSIGQNAQTEDDKQVARINRRQFLVSVGGTTATLTVIGAGIGVGLGRNSGDGTGEGSEIVSEALNRSATATPTPAPTTEAVEATAEPTPAPGAKFDESGKLIPAQGTRPEITPLDDHYRIDISSQPPVINGETWRLKVSGLVEEELEISLQDLVNNYEAVDQWVTLSCISNRIAGGLISTTRWTGVPLHLLLDEWGLLDNATHLRVVSADTFDEWVSIDMIRQDERIMLAYAWDGQPLKQKHGFPLRIYIPDLYGMKQPKWITEIQVQDEWQPGYWVESPRNWDAEAEVNPVSVVDTVAIDQAYTRDNQLYIPVGGIAYTGAKGVSKVEVTVDDGDPVEADLGDPLSDTSWVLWRYDWPYQPGLHDFSVVCYTSDGELQPTNQRGTFPSGATGIHQISTRIPSDLKQENT